MSTLIDRRVELARAGTNPSVIGRMASGWAVLGDSQFLRGYCLLLPDPVVFSLNDLDESGRTRYLLDMAWIGDALLRTTDAVRINYEILGNNDAALHVHIHARYASERFLRRRGPVWRYGRRLHSVPFDLARHAGLMEEIFNALNSDGHIWDPGPWHRRA